MNFRGHRTWYRVAGESRIRERRRSSLCTAARAPRITTSARSSSSRPSGRSSSTTRSAAAARTGRPDIEWSVAVFREEVDAVRSQLGLDRIHLLGTSWGGMLALEHVLSGAEGIVGLILSSTLASVDQWAAEQLKLRAALPADVVEVFDRHDRAGTYDDPEYEQAMEAYFDRHFYRGPKPRAELERMNAGEGRRRLPRDAGPERVDRHRRHQRLGRARPSRARSTYRR